MKLSEVLRSKKKSISATHWTTEKIRTKDFPLARGRYPLTRRWRWKVERFEALTRRFRLLVAYHTIVPEFIAVLGEEVVGDCRVLASLEYHRTHPGWHVHSSCEHIERLPIGLTRPLQFSRIPGNNMPHRSLDFLPPGTGMTDASANDIAIDFFRLESPPSLFSGRSLPW